MAKFKQMKKILFIIAIILSPVMAYSQGYGTGYGLGNSPIFLLIILVVIVLIVRLFGAWMLRINDVISELKGIRQQLDSMSQELTSTNPSDYVRSNSFDVKYSEETLERLKEGLKSHEMIILIERTVTLKVIKKSEHSKYIELGLDKGYTPIYLNE